MDGGNVSVLGHHPFRRQAAAVVRSVRRPCPQVEATSQSVGWQMKTSSVSIPPWASRTPKPDHGCAIFPCRVETSMGYSGWRSEESAPYIYDTRLRLPRPPLSMRSDTPQEAQVTPGSERPSATASNRRRYPAQWRHDANGNSCWQRTSSMQGRPRSPGKLLFNGPA